ncbi:MAG: Na+/H+ antiporter NhaC family protein [Gemmatimonadaceae bacterium]
MTPNPLTFRLGTLGALAPMLVFVAGVGTLALAGAPDERGFWPILLLALTLSRALATDGDAWSEAVIQTVAQPIVVTMLLAWLLAGALGGVLAAAGLVDGIVWLARTVGAGPIAAVGGAFLGCAVLATATGTSFGTLLVAGPVLYGAGAGLGAPPAVLLGAILAGATWGDSISPMSDTSIASAGSQGTDVAGTVRTRLQYVIPAGLVALLASCGLAALAAPGAVIAASEATTLSGRPLLLLIVPAIVVTALLRRRPLLEALLLGIGLAVGIALAAGLLAPREILRVDPRAFGATGVVIDGIGRGVGVSVFTLLLMALIGPLQASGTLDQLVARSVAAPEVRRAEWTIVGLVTVATFLTTHSVVAMLAVGPVVQRVGRAAGVTAYRRANLLDLTVCTWPFLLPWFLPTILAASVTGGGGLPPVTPGAAGLHNTYAWALLLTVGVAVVTGYGRGAEGSKLEAQS